MSDLENLRRQLIRKAREDVSSELSASDVHIVKAVNLLEDLDRIFNLMAEHCIEWHAVNFPELREMIEDNALILKLVAELSSRENFEKENVFEILNDEELSEEISKSAGNSMGSKVSEKELKQISILAVNALKVAEERKELEAFIQERMLENSPNLSQVAGSLLAARLLAKAGGLKELALMPSARVQLLGAEKALFRHLKSKRKALPPKHGLIFQHSLIQQLKQFQRGPMARSLAGKIAIAARKDFFGKKENTSQGLEDSLNERFEKLQAKKEKPKKPQSFDSRQQGFGEKRFEERKFFTPRGKRNFRK